MAADDTDENHGDDDGQQDENATASGRYSHDHEVKS